MDDARRLWRLVARYVPEVPARPAGAPGRPAISNEAVFLRIVLFLRAGCSWAVFDEMSRGCGVSGRTVRDRLALWRQLGVFEQVFEELRAQLEAPAVAHMDAMFVRARYSGDQVGLTRHGKGSKLQAIVGDDSLPLAIQMDSANPHEAHMAPALLEHLDELPALIVADKAYDTNALRDHVIDRGSRMVVPHISNRKGPPRDQHHIGRHYKNRWRIERLFSWLAAWRRLATRWEPNAIHYNGWVCLATSLIYVRGGLLP